MSALVLLSIHIDFVGQAILPAAAFQAALVFRVDSRRLDK